MLSVKNLENFNNRNSEIYNQSDFDHRTQMLANIKNILAIDENLAATVTSDKKDVDQLSTTSSVATNTNFTGEWLPYQRHLIVASRFRRSLMISNIFIYISSDNIQWL